MSDQTVPTPADVAPAPAAPAPPEPAAAAPADTPPWGDDFDAEKAWSLVQNLRSDKEKLQKRPALTDEQKTKLAEYDRLVEASQTELEKAQAAAKTNAERAQALVTRATQAEIRALASEFADPSDAVAFLADKKYAGDDGEIDTEQIKADLADLLTRKPHLGKQPTSRVPAPNPAQGSSASGAAGASQLTQDQLDGMTPEQIVQARKEGRLDRIMGIR